MSGDGTDNGTQTDDNGTGDNAGGNSTTDNTKTTDATTQGTEKTTETPATVSREEYDALMRRMQAADRRAASAENKITAAERASMSELERAKTEAAEAKADREKASVALRTAKLENAFLADDTKWHDSTDAFFILSQQFMDGVEIDENGKVTGMDVAIKALAKKKPHLVKTETASEATGSAHNGSRKGENKDTIDKNAMAARFPAAFPR